MKDSSPRFSGGNTKLGAIHGWMLPPIKTCRGASLVCLERLPDGKAKPKPRCYACREAFRQKGVKRQHEVNYEASKKPNFVKWAIAEIAKRRIKILRWHGSGDFYNAAYIKKVIAIVRATPNVKHFAFTRAWWDRKTRKESKMLPLLVELGSLSNFRLWFSLDSSMPIPPKVEGIRLCYLAINDQDEPPCQCRVFRDLPRYQKKTVRITAAHGSRVCPYEDGKSVGVTCKKCKWCIE